MLPTGTRFECEHMVVFAALTYTAAPALSLGANNTVRYFFGSK